MDMPEVQLDVYNRGMSGHKVSDLKARWEKDAIDLKPDWLSILVGVNDVSRGERSTLDFPKWEEDYRFLVARSWEGKSELGHRVNGSIRFADDEIVG